MAGMKRKELSDDDSDDENSKKLKTKSGLSRMLESDVVPGDDDSDPMDDDAFHGLSGSDASSDSSVFESESDGDDEGINGTANISKANGSKNGKAEATNGVTNSSTSRESHAKQKVLAQERKAAKPNAGNISRSKKIWERLRRKSHVPLKERKELVAELFGIVSGCVKDFVFKHDSVRVIQTALKYANLEQRKMIARELEGEYKGLAESRYAKFLIGKLLVHGMPSYVDSDHEIRDLIIPEFYGNVRRLIKHPEASWILDDTYRGIATPQQKARILREWYGAEFSLFKSEATAAPTANLSDILEEHPEKRAPIMRSLYETINHLVQKKQTGFTLLHDAMLQYILNTKTGGEDRSEFIELLKGDEEGDLLKNLAFTTSGTRVVSLALAYGTAKDRKNILRAYKETITTLAYDTHGHLVLLAAIDVIDDTVLTAKSIFSEFLGKDSDPEKQHENILAHVADKYARIPLLYVFAGTANRLLPQEEITFLEEIQSIRLATSKKEPEVRRKELIKAISPSLLSTIDQNAEKLAQSVFGCQFIIEVLLGAEGDKASAMGSVADLAMGNPAVEGHVAQNQAASRMLKTLVVGGRFDAKTGKVEPVQPPLGFAAILYSRIKVLIAQWAMGPGSFVVIALLEAEDFAGKQEILKMLRKEKEGLKGAAESEWMLKEESKGKNEEKKKANKRLMKGGQERVVGGGNMGAKILLEKLG
ncbi:MAG: pumilio domain member 6 [Candelina mexicana]|nr:MAG: pumilio domain member 6 [Candelina mexicana]